MYNTRTNVSLFWVSPLFSNFLQINVHQITHQTENDLETDLNTTPSLGILWTLENKTII